MRLARLGGAEPASFFEHCAISSKGSIPKGLFMHFHGLAPSETVPVRAAQYVRMSTEHQEYSLENQADAIARYAAANGMHIVRTYSDSAKSGLSIEDRHALQQLIRDVETGAADFRAILVYDISRWGRFQDSDESAHYEYICKRARIAVHYCAEPFLNDGSLPSSLLKAIKRMMAAEYSRELSAKVFAGKRRLIELGFRQGERPVTASADCCRTRPAIPSAFWHSVSARVLRPTE